MATRILPSALILAAAGCYASSGGRADVQDDMQGDPVNDPVEADAPPDAAEEQPITCPGPEPVEVAFSLQDPFTERYVGIREECSVERVVSTDDPFYEVHVILDCIDEAGSDVRRILNIQSSVGTPSSIHEGMDVTFSYEYRQPWWEENWFTIRGSAGDLMMAGVQASALSPGEGWYEPLEMSVVTGLCAPTEDPCYMEERVALEVAADDARMLVFDHGSDTLYVGNEIAGTLYDLHLERAVDRDEFQCTDIPGAWYKGLVFVIPGD
jgi:hypothetical protein